MFRIIQEALNNAVKYSKADRVSLFLKYIKGSLELYIKDESAGFDVGATLSDTESGTGFSSSLSGIEKLRLHGSKQCLLHMPK